MMRRILLACVAVVSLVGSAHGEPGLKFLDDILYPSEARSEHDPYEERMETERHNFTQSATTVGRGVIQLEAGYCYFYKDEHHEIEHSHTTPEMLLRLGLSEDIEFRLRWNYAWRFRSVGKSFVGSQDLQWSFKLGLTDQLGWMPKSAIEIRATAPTGGKAWSLERVVAGADYIYLWQLNEKWQIYGSTACLPGAAGDFSLLPEEPAKDHFIAYSQTAGLGVETSERTAMYLEYIALLSYGLHEEFNIQMLSFSIDYFVSDNFVVDFRIGKGLSDDADDLFTGVGGGLRF